MDNIAEFLQAPAFATPLPWQAEITFLTLAILLFGAPRILDSIRMFRDSDDKHVHHQSQSSSHEQKQEQDNEE